MKYLERAKKAQYKFTIVSGVGGGLVFLAFQWLYAFAFWIGGYLRQEKVEERGEVYTGGMIIAIMFSVIFGAFMLGGAVPHVKALTEGRIAGKLAYEILDNNPKIDSRKGGKKVTREQMQGRIEFKNVNFSYPSRAGELVLKNFSCVFEEGKTTALVGPSGSGKSTVIQMMERFYA